MAAIQERKGSYRVQFNFRGKQFGFTIGKVSETEANFKASEIDYLLTRLRQGLVEMPPGADVVEFFRHNGSPPARPVSMI